MVSLANVCTVHAMFVHHNLVTADHMVTCAFVLYVRTPRRKICELVLREQRDPLDPAPGRQVL